MSEYGKAKPKSSRGKHAVSDNQRSVLLSHFGTESLFQRGNLVDDKTSQKGESDVSFEAIIVQDGLFGGELRCKVFLPANSDIWRKLPIERKAGKD
jgi:hypothetical protein